MNFLTPYNRDKNKVMKYTNQLAQMFQYVQSRMANCQGICMAVAMQKKFEKLGGDSQVLVRSDIPKNSWRENKSDVAKGMNRCGKLLSKAIRTTNDAKLVTLFVIIEEAYSKCVKCKCPEKTTRCPVLEFLGNMDSVNGESFDE